MRKMRAKLFNRIPTWEEVEKVLSVRGWELSQREKGRLIFRRGEERIISFKTVGGMWKSEYFVGKKLEDCTGVSDADFTKLLTMELGVLK